jgi:integrase
MTAPQQERCQQLILAWDSRAQAFKNSSQLPWQELQRKLLPLWVFTPERIEEILEARRTSQGWSYGTAGHYTAALLKSAIPLGIEKPQSLVVLAKIYQKKAFEEQQRRPTKALTAADAIAVTNLLDPVAGALVKFSFLLGQRLSDAAKLQIHHIDHIVSKDREYTTFTFFRGKTVARVQPYTLHIPSNHPVMKDVKNCVGQRKTGPLFGSDDDYVELATQIKSALIQVNPEYNILSIRRGGLQHMAEKGCSMRTLLHHSRHTTPDMLMRYLEWGKYALWEAHELFREDDTA